MSYEAKLKEMGYVLDADKPLTPEKLLMHAVRTGNLVYTSGQVSRFGGKEIVGESR